ncbi:MAG: error-prone DNA polymerase, partial [Pyrinomonadaceae bacterium]
FDLKNLGYRFPAYPTPEGQSMDQFLRQRTEEGARGRYGNLSGRVQTQLDRELNLIEKLHLAGYFLIVWDLVKFCERQDILTQGRGSAANSAVCYSLGITAVDPIGMDLLFERFLSEERGEWPDIDLDLPSGDQREAVIQYVYEKYGRRGAAMTSVVITYQGRSAIREIGKALGMPIESLERLTKLIPNYSWKSPEETVADKFIEAGFSLDRQQVRLFHDLLLQILELPRHLGQHPGGMVICENDLDAVVPMEPATMPDRSIIQWDKDDCAHMGLIKVDLLGLGMMAVLKESINLIDHYYDEKVDLAHLPPDDPAVYRALQKADTIGWFQVESRAQMSSLPRTMPACFYDLVVQVAIIRPGPIVGEMAHPYMRRRQGLEPPTSLHPLLEDVLKRTLGVPLFQEQLLRMAMIVAGFSGGEAEELRRALGSKRSKKAMEEVEANLRRGMAAKGITGETQDKIVTAVTSFALYGFPESHAASFALLAYASGYLKCRYLVPYIAAMLNNLPMGFYSNSPTTLIKDAQKHGAHFLPVHVNQSDWKCTLERPRNEGRDQWVVRLGLNYIRKLRSAAGEAIVAARNEGGPFQSVQDVRRRVPLLKKDDLRALSAAGAFNFRFGEQTTHRRSALWAAELAARPVAPLLGALDERSELRSPLHAMNEVERVNADLASTGLTIGKHPFALVRPSLKEKDVAFCGLLSSRRNNSFVKIAGIVICRQRPSTARGIVFLSVEDESGMVNVILMPDTYDRFRLTVVQEPYLLIRGIVQNYQNAVSVKALWIDSLRGAVTALKSHDFH